jgi:S-adenosylmethionine decarboxylase
VQGNVKKEEGHEVKALGRHVLTEFYGCDRRILNDVELIREHMEQASRIAGATIVQSVFHLFNPHGVSGVVVIAESHMAIHTWPEYGYAAIDLFTCGEDVDPWKAYLYLKEMLSAVHVSTMEMKRGQLEFLEAEGYGEPHNTYEAQVRAAG